VNVVYPGRADDAAFRGRGEHGPEVWREEFANRRFATLVQREAFAHGRPVGGEMIRIPADRLDRAMVMRGAPPVTPAIIRTLAGPGGLHGIAPGMVGPGGTHDVAPGMAGPGGPHVGAPGMAGPGGPHVGAPGMAGPGAPAVAAQMRRGVQPMPQQYGQPQVFHTPAPSYRPGAPQYGQPGVPRPTQMMGGRAPAIPARGTPAVINRGPPQVAARPAPGGGGAAQRKK
jgi:hypothetical protein